MPDIEDMTPGQVLAEASVADFIKSLGLSIAEAQKALDENSIGQIGEFITPRDGLDGKSLLDVGLMPAFYHYQHADITCSMQLSLRVEKNIGVDVGVTGSFSDNTTSDASDSTNTTNTSSGSSTSTQERSAQIDINVASRGALSVGGDNFQLVGESPQERITALSAALRGRGDISRAIPVQNCTPIVPTPTSSAPNENVICSPNAVAFVGSGFDNGVIRIDSNPSVANSPEAYQMNNSTSVNVGRVQGTDDAAKLAYAQAVTAAIQGTPFRAVLLPAGTPANLVTFGIDDDQVKPEFYKSLKNFAGFLKAKGLTCNVNGYASTTHTNAHNDDLSERRAQAVRGRLIEHGVPAAQLPTASFGEDRWNAMGINDQEIARHRVVELVIDSDDHFILVDGDASNQLTGVTPDQIAGNDSGANGWVYVYDPQGLAALNGETVTIKGTDFTLSGAGQEQDSAEAFARNLANDVNANAGVRVQASASGNVTNLCNEGDNYRLILVTETNRSISLSGSSGVTITSQFSRSTTTSDSERNTGNRSVAVGASVDVRYARQFEMNVTGNSSISARLVSIPAPPAFLETIREFLAPSDGG